MQCYGEFSNLIPLKFNSFVQDRIKIWKEEWYYLFLVSIVASFSFISSSSSFLEGEKGLLISMLKIQTRIKKRFSKKIRFDWNLVFKFHKNERSLLPRTICTLNHTFHEEHPHYLLRHLAINPTQLPSLLSPALVWWGHRCNHYWVDSQLNTNCDPYIWNNATKAHSYHDAPETYHMLKIRNGYHTKCCT